LLDNLVSRNGRLVFTHDPRVAMARVARDSESGRYSVDDSQAQISGLNH